MKKISWILAVIIVIQVISVINISVFAWTYKDDGKFEVATHNAPVVEDGEIKLDAQLDDCYIGGTKVASYPDDTPYYRGKYEEVYGLARGGFVAYIAVDTNGLYVYAEIEDATIFSTTNNNGNDGDCFQIYLDWCPENVVHPSADELYAKYKNGTPWDYAAYKTTYAKGGNQYLGWVSGDYNGVAGGAGGFNSFNKMGSDKNESLVYKTRFTDDGWACEWFIPWRDQTQKNAIANGDQFHCGIGFQANDDSDINDTVTPGAEENVAVTYDQRREQGGSYWADYSLLADVAFVEPCEHSWDLKKSVDNTCNAYGYNAYDCTECGGEKTDRIEAAHKEEIAYICTVAGKKDIVCADCGETISLDISVNTDGMAESHVYERQSGSVDATCTEGGCDLLKCKYCGYETEKEILPKHSCRYNNKLEGYLCDICGVKIKHGDANGDGAVTNSDVLAIFRYIYDSESYPVPAFEAADVNCDGKVTNADVLEIYRYVYNAQQYPITRENDEFQINGIGASEYTVVYSKNNKVAKQLADKICDAIEEACGIRPDAVSDSEPYRKGTEIFVGHSQRTVDNALISNAINNISDGEYLIFKGKEFIYVGGKSNDDVAMAAAANKMISVIGSSEEDYVDISITEGVKPEGTKYSVITYNDGDNSTTKTSQVATILRDYAPDIIGMQEVQSKHISVYESLMPGYKGIYYDHDTSRYGAPIFYKTSKFTLVESGTQWLSDTPDTKYSVFKESDYIRSYVYAILRDRSTGEEIVAVNTHVDYIAAANTKQVAVLLDCTERFKGKTVIYTGDFNMRVTSAGYKKMSESGFVDCGTVLGVNVYTHIDFCFVDLGTALPVAYKYIDDHQYSTTASDHNPVYSEILVGIK